MQTIYHSLTSDSLISGNEFFKKNQYPEAVKEYSDAIKRNPKDAALYSNRAAAYSKLMAYSDALKDCDTCIATDPKFIKGYTRKAAVYNAMKDYRKAMTMWEKALEVDPNNQEVLSGYSQTMMKIQSKCFINLFFLSIFCDFVCGTDHSFKNRELDTCVSLFLHFH